MSRGLQIAAALVVTVAIITACSGDDDADAGATTTTAAAAAAETTLVDPPRCDDLTDPVDHESLQGVGCLEGDGVVSIATTAECADGDGTVVFISDRMGLDGGEWVDADEDWASLCP